MTFDPKRTSQPRYIRMDDKLWEAVKEYAKRDRRPITMQLELIVDEWLKLKDMEDVLDSTQGDD